MFKGQILLETTKKGVRRKKKDLPLDAKILRSTWESSIQEVEGAVGSRFVVLNPEYS